METKVSTPYKRKPKRKRAYLHHNKKAKPDHSFRLSELKLLGAYNLDNRQAKQYAPYIDLLYNGLSSLYPEISKCPVADHSIGSILHTICEFVNQKHQLYDINFIKECGKPQIHIYRCFDLEDYKVFNLEIENVLSLKLRNKKLYNILISFIGSLSFAGIEDDHYNYEPAIWSVEERILDDCFEANEDKNSYIQGLKNYKTFQKDLYKYRYSGWKKQLNNYKPRLKPYKLVKDFLMESSKLNLDVLLQLPDRTLYENTESIGEDEAVTPSKVFVISTKPDCPILYHYMDYISHEFNNYGSIPPLDILTIDHNAKVKDFSHTQKEIDDLRDFVIEFNNLMFNVNQILP